MATHFFHSGMVGAPTNTNAAGSTLAIIRAVLSTGFNLLTPQTATVASGVMTLTYSAPHGYEDKVLLRLDGAPGGSVVRRVTASAGSSSLTIPAPGFADGAVSGSLSTRVAPADWEEVFTGADKAVYRSKATGPGCTRFYYRVADTASGSGPRIFRGFEGMTDVDTGIGSFPSVAQETGNGIVIDRANSSSALAWVAVCDKRTCYLFLSYNPANANLYGMHFGDISPLGSSDFFCAAVSKYNSSGGMLSGLSPLFYSPRSANSSGSSIVCLFLNPIGASGEQSRAYPSPIDGGMLLARPIVTLDSDSAAGAIRGTFRGLTHCSANPLAGTSSVYQIFSGISGIDGRVAVVRDAGVGGCVAFPIDEDWA